MYDTHFETGTKQLREFGLLMAIMFAVIFGLLFPWIWEFRYPAWPWVVSGMFAVSGLLVPGLLKPVFHLWMKLALVLGWINTRIILGFIFYVFFVPLGWMMRLFGYDPLKLKLDKSALSYRVKSNVSEAKNMERPF